MAEPTQSTPAAKGASITAIAGGAALGTVLVAAVLAIWALRGGPEADGTEPAAETSTQAAAPASVAAPPPADPASAPAPEDGATAPDAAEAVLPDPPRFDLVRIDPNGSAVIAGRAVALAEVTLAIDGTPVEVVAADAGGQFVAMLALAPSDAPRILSLQAMLPGGVTVAGPETVLIAPFDGETPVAEVALATEATRPPEAPGIGETTSASPDLAGTADGGVPAADGVAGLPAASGDAAPVAQTAPPEAVPAAPAAQGLLAPVAEALPAAPAAVEEAPAAPTAQGPAVLLADSDGIRVLQAPGAPPEALTEVELDAISYDLDGAVTLAGRGPAEASVQVTLNNRPINLGEIGPGGQWSLDLPDVDPGTYTLRLDQIAADGTITRGPETPFLREDPARIRDNPMLVADGASVITVQRGFTLWGIAEANFGDGILYVQIFAENRDAIRDPDLIFPGQIFALPDLPRAAGDE